MNNNLLVQDLRQNTLSSKSCLQNNQLTGSLNVLDGLPLTDLYDGNSFDNGPAPPPPPYTPPPPGRSHNNRSNSPGSHAPRGSDGQSSNPDDGNKIKLIVLSVRTYTFCCHVGVCPTSIEFHVQKPGIFIWETLLRYGLLDAMFQSMVVIGALADDSAILSRYTGFYKGVQSTGATVAWQIDTHKVSFVSQFVVNWVLCTISYPLLVVLVILAVKDENKLVEEAIQLEDTNGALSKST